MARRTKQTEGIRFKFDHRFTKAGAAKILGGLNPDLPVPYGDYAVLSFDQEQELFLKYNYAKYRASKIKSQRAIAKWLRLAKYYKEVIAYHNLRLAFKYVQRGLDSFSFNDVESIESDAMLALNNAIEGFDCSQGWRFSTFCVRCVLNAISGSRGRMRRHNRLKFFPGLSYDVDSCDGGVAAVDAEHDTKVMVLYNRILNNTEKYVIVSRYGLGDGVPHTLAEVGRAIGACSERVRQIERNALDKIRNQYGIAPVTKAKRRYQKRNTKARTYAIARAYAVTARN